MTKIKIRVKNTSKYDLPVYETPGSSGFDIRANVARPTTIPVGGRALIPTGLHFELPEDYEIQIRSRSGLAMKHGIIVLNSPGTIDSDYKDEVCILLINLGDQPFEVKPGDRVAQGVFASVVRAEFEGAIEISKENDRGGGFGHTGV